MPKSPYVYTGLQPEFPRFLHKAGGETCIVSTQEERNAKLEDGWSPDPVLEDGIVIEDQPLMPEAEIEPIVTESEDDLPPEPPLEPEPPKRGRSKKHG